jgi:N-acyl-D-amino-acid deacylase
MIFCTQYLSAAVKQVLAIVVCLSPTFAAADPFDLVFEGGLVFTGAGDAMTKGDIAIRDGRIALVGDASGLEAEQRISIEGRVIAPGFIDIHSHADDGNGGGLRSNMPERRAAHNVVMQGVTTVVVNPDGNSPKDIARQRKQLEKAGFGPNVVLMAGHNTIRRQVLGKDNKRAATDSEIAAMGNLLRKTLDAGAYGLTAGLEYEPGIWSTTAELIALCEELKADQRPFIVHERASGADPMWYLPSQHEAQIPTMVDNIRELIEIAETAGVTVVATHIKARGVPYWGKSAEIIALIEAARTRGVSIYADQYPYNSSGSDGHLVLVPDWVFELRSQGNYGGQLRAAMDQNGKAVRDDMAYEIERRGGAAQILITGGGPPEWVGRSLAEEAQARGLSPVDLAIQLQLDYGGRKGGVALRGFSMSEADVNAFAAQPWCATASDGGIAQPGDGPRIHPRYYGAFARKLGEFVRDRQILSLEAALRSMTTLPAEIMGFQDRGLLSEGAVADVVVFDPETIEARATFFTPHQYAAGVDYVLINGAFAVRDGEPTGALPGSIVTHAKAE